MRDGCAGPSGPDLDEELDGGSLKMALEGFKTMAPLPSLTSGKVNRTTRLREWIFAVGMILSAVSDEVEAYWHWANGVATKAHQIYLETPIMHRNTVKVQVPVPLRYKPLEGKFKPHLLAAVPQDIKEVIVARGISGELTQVTHVLFELLKDFSPGGLEDRGEVLHAIEHPRTGNNPTEAVRYLQGVAAPDVTS